MILVRTDAIAITPDELRRRFERDVIAGLRSPRRSIPCKYLYDKRGSQLFEQICSLDEYYLTRTELQILETHAPEIGAFLGPRTLLIEPGCGSGRKTRLILSAMQEPAGYIAMDIACETLDVNAEALRREFAGLDVRTVWADFTEVAGLGELTTRGDRSAVFFPGSTIGNFEPPDAQDLLARFGGWTGNGGRMIIGVDLKKDPSAVKPAYNDAAGVTAAFNLNLLARMNRELDTDVDAARFAHSALYRPKLGRVEMHLISLDDQEVNVRDTRIMLRAGDTIQTESSYKYRLVDFSKLAARAGWHVDLVWTDPRAWFAVVGCSWVRQPLRRR
jgi:L-histidine Nalpha-methyltransferase